eukprot:XP_025000628.1 uncharacterized protein LOC112530550 [Gallus gallus]
MEEQSPTSGKDEAHPARPRSSPLLPKQPKWLSEQFPSTSSTHAGCRRGGGLNRCPLPIREALPPPSAPGEKFAGCAPQLRDPQQMLRYGNGSLHACMPVCA